MRKYFQPKLIIVTSAASHITAGCATVNPHADYERAATLIGVATGSDAVYWPDDDERVEATIQALLKDG